MLMQGKKGLIMGVANDKSIAWGIAKSLAENGASIALTYQGETLKKTVIPDIAPTISALLGISFPNGATGTPLGFVLD